MHGFAWKQDGNNLAAFKRREEMQMGLRVGDICVFNHSSFRLLFFIHNAIRRSNEPTTKIPTTIGIASAEYGNSPVSADTQLFCTHDKIGPASLAPNPNLSHNRAFPIPKTKPTAI
mmetsp:Transcript_105/g.248  ORF Transcript_105/g.248 Transcript_105/m.248 type:complete len:116 (-) Transcript_105:444-791(-)